MRLDCSGAVVGMCAWTAPARLAPREALQSPACPPARVCVCPCMCVCACECGHGGEYRSSLHTCVRMCARALSRPPTPGGFSGPGEPRRPAQAVSGRLPPSPGELFGPRRAPQADSGRPRPAPVGALWASMGPGEPRRPAQAESGRLQGALWTSMGPGEPHRPAPAGSDRLRGSPVGLHGPRRARRPAPAGVCAACVRTRARVCSTRVTGSA